MEPMEQQSAILLALLNLCLVLNSLLQTYPQLLGLERKRRRHNFQVADMIVGEPSGSHRQMLLFLHELQQVTLAKLSFMRQDSGWWVKERSNAWFREFLMSKYSDTDIVWWKRDMRMGPARFFSMVEVMKPHLTLKTTNWRSPHPPEVVPLFIKVYGNVISWPTTQEEIREIVNGFAQFSKLPGIVGAIDGCDIRMDAPKIQNAIPYYSGKIKGHAVILQAVVDHRKKFMSVCTGYPRSFSDARILRLSQVYYRARQDMLLWQQNLVPLLPAGEITSYLVGDKIYPCMPWLMAPFKHGRGEALAPKKNRFNHELSEARIEVERTFGDLKGIWRDLKHISSSMKLDFLCQWIHFACILNNLYQDNKDMTFDDLDELVDEEIRAARLAEEEAMAPDIPLLRQERGGAAKRAQLVRHLQLVD